MLETFDLSSFFPKYYFKKTMLPATTKCNVDR